MIGLRALSASLPPALNYETLVTQTGIESGMGILESRGWEHGVWRSELEAYTQSESQIYSFVQVLSLSNELSPAHSRSASSP